MDGEIVSEKLLEALSVVGYCLLRVMPRPGRDNGMDCPDCSRQSKSAAAPIAQKDIPQPDCTPGGCSISGRGRENCLKKSRKSH